MWRLKGAVAQKAAGLVSRADCWPGAGHGLGSRLGGFKSRQAPRLAEAHTHEGSSPMSWSSSWFGFELNSTPCCDNREFWNSSHNLLIPSSKKVNNNCSRFLSTLRTCGQITDGWPRGTARTAQPRVQVFLCQVNLSQPGELSEVYSSVPQKWSVTTKDTCLDIPAIQQVLPWHMSEMIPVWS